MSLQSRRSLRNLGKEAPNYGEHVLDYAEMKLTDRTRKPRLKTKGGGKAKREYITIPAPPAKDSSRSLIADVALLRNEYLGEEMPGRPTKQDVMLASGEDQDINPRWVKCS